MNCRITASVAILVMLAVIITCGEPPQVVQGTVVSYSPEAKSLIVKNELPPNDDMVFDLSRADIGRSPQPGDSVRLSYRVDNGKLMAVRVMDLARGVEAGSGGH